MRQFARWHVWLGWLAGIPLVLWTFTGLIMVARPIDEVRGAHLRLDRPALRLTDFDPNAALAAVERQAEKPTEITFRMGPDRRPMMLASYDGGSVRRFDAVSGRRFPALSSGEAESVVKRHIVGGDNIVGVRSFSANSPPLDLRSPVPVWQVTLKDGTHVYVNRDTGDIAAVRTRWWRMFDFMWGLHIMDLETREDTHHPILIGFAGLALLMSGLGCVLMFRRRKAKVV